MALLTSQVCTCPSYTSVLCTKKNFMVQLAPHYFLKSCKMRSHVFLFCFGFFLVITFFYTDYMQKFKSILNFHHKALSGHKYIYSYIGALQFSVKILYRVELGKLMCSLLLPLLNSLCFRDVMPNFETKVARIAAPAARPPFLSSPWFIFGRARWL